MKMTQKLYRKKGRRLSEILLMLLMIFSLISVKRTMFSSFLFLYVSVK